MKCACVNDLHLSVPLSKVTLDAALKSTMGTFFVRPVVEARVSNTPNFGLITSVGDVTRSRTPGGINRCDVETSSGLFVFKDRIVCVCVN